MREFEESKFGIKTAIMFIGSLIVTNLTLLGVDGLAFFFLAFAFFLDLISGIGKSIVMKKFSSSINFTRITVKLIVLGIIICFGLGILLVTGISPKIMVIAFIAALGINDILSAIGNIHVMLTRKELPERDVLPLIISMLHEKAFKILNKILNKIKKTNG
jgi:phage-related holin